MSRVDLGDPKTLELEADSKALPASSPLALARVDSSDPNRVQLAYRRAARPVIANAEFLLRVAPSPEYLTTASTEAPDAVSGGVLFGRGWINRLSGEGAAPSGKSRWKMVRTILLTMRRFRY
jgi:hypothetical protein